MNTTIKSNNRTLFLSAHKMTRLTIQKGYVYREVFGQWLIYLKNGITNTLGYTNINQSVCYVPILKHDVLNQCNEYKYSLSLPLTLTRSKANTGYSESYYLGKMLLSLLVSIPFLIFVIILVQSCIIYNLA